MDRARRRPRRTRRQSLPRARGWTDCSLLMRLCQDPSLPRAAWMDRSRRRSPRLPPTSLPRARGWTDGPDLTGDDPISARVTPTCAWMDRVRARRLRVDPRHYHVRVDGPFRVWRGDAVLLSLPRARGWTVDAAPIEGHPGESLPTCAWMDRKRTPTWSPCWTSLTRARGCTVRSACGRTAGERQSPCNHGWSRCHQAGCDGARSRVPALRG
jgi:hypothetical protein